MGGGEKMSGWVCDQGLNALLSLGAGLTTDPIAYMALSTSLLDPSHHPEWIAIPSEVTEGTYARVLCIITADTGNKKMIWEATFLETNIETSTTINMIGLCIGSVAAANDLIAAVDIDPVEKNSSKQIKFRITVTASNASS